MAKSKNSTEKLCSWEDRDLVGVYVKRLTVTFATGLNGSNEDGIENKSRFYFSSGFENEIMLENRLFFIF